MKEKRKWLLICGVILISVSLVTLLFSVASKHIYQKHANELAEQIEALIPERTPGIPEELSHMDMPALRLKEQDFIGLIEIPSYGINLPLCGSWNAGRINRYPCRFDGTVYNNSLIIGGSDGQLSCLKKIGHGETVTVTDMQGAEYKYTVTNIRRSSDAHKESLQKYNDSLVLFIRDTYTLEYIIVSCN